MSPITRYLLHLGCCLWTVAAAGQVSDSVRTADLDSAFVQATRITVLESLSASALLTDHLPLRTATEVLAYVPGVSLRLGGPTGITTLRYRGLAGDRIRRTWQGLRVDNPQLGANDLAAEHPALLSQLALSSQPLSPAAAELSASQDSKSGASLSAGVSEGGGYQLSARVHGLRAVATRDGFNNRFYSPSTQEVFENARLSQLGLSYRADAFSRKLTSTTFAQSTKRSYRLAGQGPIDLDYLTLRQLVSYQPDSNLTLQLGYLHDQVGYDDPRLGRSQGTTHQIVVAGSYLLHRQLTFASDTRYVNSRHTEYSSGVNAVRTETSVRARHGWEWATAEATVGVLTQAELGSGLFGGVEVTSAVASNWQVTASASRTLRLPILDDVRWAQGGQSNLAPERGLAAELKLTHTYKSSSVEWVGFARRTQDYLLWLPGIPFWQPTNVRLVTALGASVVGSHQLDLAGGLLSLSQSVDYLSLRPDAGTSVAELSLDAQQLPFNPQWQALTRAVYRHGALHTALDARYTSQQLTAYADLPARAYWEVRGSVAWQFERATLRLVADNLFDSQIPTVFQAATPLRRLSLEYTFTFSSPSL